MTRAATALPSVERMLELGFEHDELAGVLTCHGHLTGEITSTGHVRIYVDNRRYLAHRLIWKLAYGEDPDGEVDHVNGDRADNRLSNLRLCSRSQNAWNCGPFSTNTSGFKGVNFDRGKWRAAMCVNGKTHHLGRFDTKEAAAEAYREASLRLHGRFAHGSFRRGIAEGTSIALGSSPERRQLHAIHDPSLEAGADSRGDL